MNDGPLIATVLGLLTAVGGGAGIWTWASNRQGNAVGAASDAVSMVRDQLNYARSENTELRSKVDRLHDDLEDVKNELRAVREELAQARAVADEASRWQTRYDDAAQRASTAESRAAELAAQLRSHGIDPMPHAGTAGTEQRSGPELVKARVET